MVTMENDKKSGISITNNFNAPIGQFIEHVDTVNFRMDGEGNFHFGNVENVNRTKQEQALSERDEEMFHFVHPSIEAEEGWRIHDAVKRLVAHQRIQDICQYLKDLSKKNKILLPQSPSSAYKELVRMGMPNGEGYSEKYFSSCYIK